MDAPVSTGCVVPSRVIGVIEAEQTENGQTERNDRLLAVATKSATHRSIQELHDVSDDLIAQIEHFFVSYNAAKGKRFEVKRRAGKKRARSADPGGSQAGQPTATLMHPLRDAAYAPARIDRHGCSSTPGCRSNTRGR